MVLDKLGQGLKNTLRKIAGSVFYDKKLVEDIVKDIQRALLAADVNVQLVFDLSKKIKERALEEKPPKGLDPREYLVKIVYEELVKFLGEEKKGIEIKKTPFKIMFVGLYGSGKCVHPDSNIVLSSGEIIKAEDLYDRYSKNADLLEDGEIVEIKEDLFVPSFNPKTLKVEKKKVTHLWKLNGKQLLDVYLDNGNDFSVKVTPEHPFFVLRKGKVEKIRADQLSEDDFVAVPRKYDVEPTKIDLLEPLKKLDLDVYLGSDKVKELLIKFDTIKNLHSNLKFKRNYCKFTTSLRKGKIPIEYINLVDTNYLRLKSRKSKKSISFPLFFNSDFAEFLGYLVGDGYIYKNYVQISNQDEEIIQRVCELSKDLFNIVPTVKKDIRTKNLYRITLASETLVYILNSIFGFNIGKKGRSLKVPRQILLSNNEIVRCFLKAYFDCDSYAAPNTRSIELVSESKILIQQVSLLLRRFDILSTVSKKFVNNVSYWRLHVNARFAEIYADKIGYLIKSKNEKISRYKDIGLLQGCGKQDMLPVGKLLKELRLAFGFSIGEIQNNAVFSYGIYEEKGIISREQLLNLLNYYKTRKKGIFFELFEHVKQGDLLKDFYSNAFVNGTLPYLINSGLIKKEKERIILTENGQQFLVNSLESNSEEIFQSLYAFATSNVSWCGIKEIKEIEKPDFVYDLTVEDNHSFIADGIIVHNTTTIGKLARYYAKRGNKVCAVGLDVHRPAAPEQLKQMCDNAGVKSFIMKGEKDPMKIWKAFAKHEKDYDVILVDTAGRDALSKDLIKEIKDLGKKIKAEERILVMSADLGQAAQKQAEAFHESCDITGVIITKLDGTAKGGGALTGASVTNAKIKFIGVGEKIDDLEEFNPEGFVSRMLGMGDIEALLEKAKEVMTEEQAQDMGKKFLKGDFNLLDLYEQMQAMSKMGPLNKIVDMMPGMGKVDIPKEMLNVQEGKLKRWKFIMQSCTKKELEEPDIVLNRQRIDRIAKGSGTTSKEVRELLKQYKQSKKLVKHMKPGKNMDVNKLMKKFKGKNMKGMKF